MRIEDQPPAPVDVLNSYPKDFLRTQPGILDDDEDVFHRLFRYRQQLRLAFWIYSLLPTKFFEQSDSWCIVFVGNVLRLHRTLIDYAGPLCTHI